MAGASIPDVRHRAGEGLRPFEPCTETRRGAAPAESAADAAVGRLLGRQAHERQAPLGVRERTVNHGRQIASRFLRVRSGPAGDRRGRPCRIAVAGQPEGLASVHNELAPLRCRGAPEPGPHRPPPAPCRTSRRRAAHRPQRTGTAAGAGAQQITEKHVTNHSGEIGKVEAEGGQKRHDGRDRATTTGHPERASAYGEVTSTNSPLRTTKRRVAGTLGARAKGVASGRASN